MIRTTTLMRQSMVLVLFSSMSIGCGSSTPSTLSPTAESKPELSAKADEETQARKLRDQEAERKMLAKLKGRR